jgi:glycosyltransferase involved in cell wall biosynthesis
MKVAFVHDWFNANGGAEKVAGEILDIFADDDVTVYALFNKFGPEAEQTILKGRKVVVTPLQYVPYISKFYRYFFPFMPWLMSRVHLSGYDLIVSTSHAVAKGYSSDGVTPSICYCHTPLRPIWDMYDDYAAQMKWGGSLVYRRFVQWLRRWDKGTADRVGYFIANSGHIAQRIARSYERESVVVYPPVRTTKFELNEQKRKEYYMCPGRFVPYKKIDLVIRAFKKMPDKRLVLLGEGWGESGFAKLADGCSNIEWLGYKEDEEMIKYMQEAKACIFAAKEDFGIMCVESQACGTPVIALDYGGYKETVVDGKTGYLFAEQTEEAIIAAVTKMDAQPLTDYVGIRNNALRFSDARFKEEFKNFVSVCLVDYRARNKR